MDELITRLEALAAIPDAEIRSRVSAAGELKQGLNAAIVALHAAQATRQSSPEISSLAAKVMGWTETTPEIVGEDNVNQQCQSYNQLLRDAKRLAGSVLSQDETPGQGEAQEREDEPNAAINRTLTDAQLQGQAKPITETVPVVAKGPPTAPIRDEGDNL